jgi:protoporphyrinogen oxidase
LPSEVARECLLGFLQARDAELERERNGTAGPAKDFEEFILRFMGEGIARHFMVPYNTKLWGVPPAQMSAAWTDRFVPRPTMEEVVAGAVGCNDQELGYNAQFYYPRQGIGVLPQALAGQVKVELNQAPAKIDFAQRRIYMAGEAESIAYERLISTIPLDRLFSLMEGLPPAVAEAVQRLRVTSLYYLDIAFNRPTPREDLHWVYVPEERYPFYRVGLYSNFSSALVPAGGASMYVELASRELPDVDRLLPSVLEGLQEMGLVRTPDEVAFVRLRHLPQAYVIYDQAYRESLDLLHPFLAEQGIFSRGRYGSWEYSAMEDALRAGREVARAVEEDL